MDKSQSSVKLMDHKVDLLFAVRLQIRNWVCFVYGSSLVHTKCRFYEYLIDQLKDSRVNF